MYITDTIAAISTPPGQGGISLVRLSGPEAIAIAAQVFFPFSGCELAALPGYTARYGRFRSGGRVLDTGVALVYRAPKSYTGEDVAELMCHGGELVSAAVLRALLDAGARPADRGEFTKRAYLNGKLSLTEAEAVCDIITAGSRVGAAAAVSASQGALGRETDRLKRLLLEAASHIAAWLDYPEEDVEPVETARLLSFLRQTSDGLERLLAGYERGEAVLRGVCAAIVGTPNVGKSTLMNLLCGSERSIVTAVPGTTRDVVETTVRLGSTSIVLSDTAGIRATDDIVEAAGVQRAVDRIGQSQLVLAVFDGSRPLTDDDRAVVEKTRTLPAIAVVNKGDLPETANVAELERAYGHVVRISARDPGALEVIDRAVAGLTGIDSFDPSAPLLATERQRAAAVRAGALVQEAARQIGDGVTLDVVSDTISAAHAALCELSGEDASEAVVNEVFSRFCVGK